MCVCKEVTYHIVSPMVVSLVAVVRGRLVCVKR